MFFATFLSTSVVIATLVGVGFSAPDQAARLLDGQDVDTLRQFPHHVYIIPFGSNHRCGGTILNNQWVLTSASCVKDSIRLDLNFGKKSVNNTRADFFSVSVNKEHVFLYPTNYDDIALIKIPLRLVFSETIAPVTISKLPSHSLDHRFSVMPGFNEIIIAPTTTTYATTTTWLPTTPAVSTTASTTSSTTKTSTTSSTTKSTSTTPRTTTTTFVPTPPNVNPYPDIPPTPPPPPTTTPPPTPPPPPTATYSEGETEFSFDLEPQARHFEGEHYDHGLHPLPHPEVDGLKYGMFSIVDHHVCKHALGQGRFDEYTQLCVEGWGNNPNAPCCSDFGSGLIIGWPAQSELVGIFSMFSPACTTKLPSVFTYVAKYLPWIEGMIRG